MKLIWGSGSPPCVKVMMVLEEKGLLDKCETQQIQFSKKEHKGEDVLKLNPRGQVPTFSDGEIVVNESTAICMYLDKYYGDLNSLIPQDKKLNAEVLQRMSEQTNITKTVFMEVVVPMMFPPKDQAKPDPAVIDEKIQKCHDELKIWDGFLAGGKTYLVGNSFTMADVFLYVDMCMLVRQGLDLGKFYPNLGRFYTEVSKRKSAEKSKPPHWAEDPGKKPMANYNPSSGQTKK